MKLISDEVAKQWFIKAISSLASPPFSKLTSILYTRVPKTLPPIGDIILFQYDPKHKDDLKVLPYYDVFPLALVVGFLEDHFYAINLHYIPPTQRTQIINYLILEKKKATSARQYINKVYPTLRHLTKSNLCMFGFKKYLIQHVRSQIIDVKPNYWKLVSKLPLYHFVRTTANQVWLDAVKAARRLK